MTLPVEATWHRPSRIGILWRRAPVSTALIVGFLAADIVVAAAPPQLVSMLALWAPKLTRPWGWYRFLTYGFVQPGVVAWLMVSAVILASGWIAERWLGRRAMWTVVFLSTMVSGFILVVIAPSMPAIGGGFIAAGFAGAAVASAIRRRRFLSRGAQVVALVLLLLYGLTPLRVDPVSLAMFGAFIAAGGYALRHLRRPTAATPSALLESTRP